MSLSVVEKKKYTYADYLKTPDDQRWELIDGELLVTPSPATRHQRVSRRIEFALEKYVTERGVGEVFYAPLDVRLDDENVVQPDILFVSGQRAGIIGEKNVEGAPDLVIEIISEGSAYQDLIRKKKLYARFGVREYWIVDPGQEFVEVHCLKDNAYALWRAFSRDDTLESPMFPGFSVGLPAVFQ